MADPRDVDLARRQRLYNDARFSDVTICFSGNKVHAHKAILPKP
ncbi:uncharacterized protein RCC_08888 [Ramularia collo-cygni]|uniref:BTB domain-containing protein n=1 Tax=Ramularia collo-cygni TaxID=112498 RepID=A0A2D3VN88_9PEZI|nr:uncharacterized protein RCC_08888 [Ramularia collo-cygni]CZT23178.1 uncharacterized protein RCC_08888 [Ramularia collo-cygni]